MAKHYEFDPDAYDSPYYDEEAEKRSIVNWPEPARGILPTYVTLDCPIDWGGGVDLGGGSLALYDHDSPVWDDVPDSIREARDR